ncbi:hypothetical protein L0668_19495 [Paraglaciecola aquimarina]|uniref:Phosphate ABC transporter substrate-binding protein n=1 Tax=Paraglaciecola algarum TaxID=3050085 RepID=A0ABS9DE39_9ALTE|nr:hypothetical protein [Paraglaciecola sp. G1-23]MCF2950302.1 hypothetical protein [Paraglaciecola sp. G1-23]
MKYFIIFCVFWICIFAGIRSEAAQSQFQKVKVIVNTSVPASTVSEQQIRRIFSMRQTVWANNQSITVFVLDKKHQVHQAFSTNTLGMFPYQLERVWNKLVYSGLGEEPIKVNSEQEMLDRISRNPGSIGYINSNTEYENVKVLKVIKE